MRHASETDLWRVLTAFTGLRLFGSAVGTKEEVQELFQLAVRGEVKPLIKVVPFDQIDETAKKLEKGQFTGRVVMPVPQS